MIKKLVEYCKNRIDEEDFRYALAIMKTKRYDLPKADWELYNDLEILVLEFIENNELSDEWFETKIGSVEDLFDDIVKTID